MASGTSAKAWPVAQANLTISILALVQQASYLHRQQLKKGANEAIETLRHGVAEFIILAADTEPFEILDQLPLFCQDKNVPYIYLPSKAALGRACGGVARPVFAVSVTTSDNKEFVSQINKIKLAIRKAMI